MPSALLLHPDAGLNLSIALIASSQAPLVLLDGALNVIGASASFCNAFGLDPAEVAGRPLLRLGAGEWEVPQLQSLLKATLAGHTEIESYEIDLDRPGHARRRLVLNARKLEYGLEESVRLLLTVSDVTDARAAQKARDDLLRDKDNLLHEKAMLLQELHHRIANSLQIIAAVLLQSARRVNSQETRGHLFDAHSRVMSVAALQQQLAASQVGEIHLRSYLTDLCRSIGASMISDPDQLALKVCTDGSVINADVSVKLGLIVTELVINALKHAFPHHRRGEIVVDYRAAGSNWTLTVTDDGVGMPANLESAKPGLGTTIVEALAKQLNAQIEITASSPGTSVCVVHGDPGLAAAA
ncbi:MAG TPA: histidine kinase dimerization/phosphoacceptor domain -containing protein [Caulobacteraceae bacterium]|nr:histidine kinase dimerization/phosphoacceptor domain -containing protein [Caulobacteraceae bacterium]